MTTGNHHSTRTSLRKNGTGSPTMWKLHAAAVSLCCVFSAINFAWLYPHRLGLASRPILCVVALYMIASAIWIYALRIGTRQTSDRRLVIAIAVFALSFRTIQICAPPILELDLYRYMWDGIVINNGESPYRYSPNQILTDEVVIHDAQLKNMVAVANKTEAHHAIVSRVHFPDYTTIYPPASQLVFAAAMYAVPDSASVTTHLTAIKLTLVLFDLLTIGLVFCLLRVTGLHAGWAIAYAWNPLVIKEIANSGHLDSIAVCLMTSAALVVARGLRTKHSLTPLNGACAGLLLAISTAAKLFPVVLMPLFLVAVAKRRRRAAISFATTYVIMTALFMSWMLAENKVITRALDRPTVTKQETAKEGLSSFLTHWRMNDAVFSFVYENVKPANTVTVNRPWYIVVPNTLRVRIDRFLRSSRLTESPPFLIARVFTVAAFACIYAVLLWRLRDHPPSPTDFLELIFLVLAAFFFLQPTQNPWYWVWAMPFVCFARNRGWLLVAGFLFAYYIRFWFKFSDLEFSFAGYQYARAGIFDHCVVWLEHLAILIAVRWSPYWQRNRGLKKLE